MTRKLVLIDVVVDKLVAFLHVRDAAAAALTYYCIAVETREAPEDVRIETFMAEHNIAVGNVLVVDNLRRIKSDGEVFQCDAFRATEAVISTPLTLVYFYVTEERPESARIEYRMVHGYNCVEEGVKEGEGAIAAFLEATKAFNPDVILSHGLIQDKPPLMYLMHSLNEPKADAKADATADPEFDAEIVPEVEPESATMRNALEVARQGTSEYFKTYVNCPGRLVLSTGEGDLLEAARTTDMDGDDAADDAVYHARLVSRLDYFYELTRGYFSRAAMFGLTPRRLQELHPACYADSLFMRYAARKGVELCKPSSDLYPPAYFDVAAGEYKERVLTVLVKDLRREVVRALASEHRVLGVASDILADLASTRDALERYRESLDVNSGNDKHSSALTLHVMVLMERFQATSAAIACVEHALFDPNSRAYSREACEMVVEEERTVIEFLVEKAQEVGRVELLLDTSEMLLIRLPDDNVDAESVMQRMNDYLPGGCELLLESVTVDNVVNAKGSHAGRVVLETPDKSDKSDELSDELSEELPDKLSDKLPDARYMLHLMPGDEKADVLQKCKTLSA